MDTIKIKLSGGDLRSIKEVNQVIPLIDEQHKFDYLFHLLYSPDRLLIMRAADAIEKISLKCPQYLQSHKEEIIALALSAKNKEFKWHLALLLPRVSLTYEEHLSIFNLLKDWMLDPNESKIVRVNAMQSLWVLTKMAPSFKPRFMMFIQELEKENIPSIQARIRKLTITLDD